MLPRKDLVSVRYYFLLDAACAAWAIPTLAVNNLYVAGWERLFTPTNPRSVIEDDRMCQA